MTLRDYLETSDIAGIRHARARANQIVGGGEPAPARMELDVNPPRSTTELASMIDHCVLGPTVTTQEVVEACRAARRDGFRALCVNPARVELAAENLQGSGIAVVAMVSFPQGQSTTSNKVHETKDAIAHGAQAIDMVADLAALSEGNHTRFVDDIVTVVEFAYPLEVIVIIETGVLGDPYKKALGASLAEFAGARVVKTSTGFAYTTDKRDSPRALGCRAKDVATIACATSANVGVKAAGGIRTFDQARQMIAAGATRIGTSNGPLIVATPTRRAV